MIMKLVCFFISFVIICILKIISDNDRWPQWFHSIRWLTQAWQQNLLIIEFITFLSGMAIYGLFFIYKTAKQQLSLHESEMEIVLRDLNTTNNLFTELVDSQTRTFKTFDEQEAEDNKMLRELEQNFTQLQKHLENEKTMKQELNDNHLLHCSSIESTMQHMLASSDATIEKQCAEANKSLELLQQFYCRQKLQHEIQIPHVFLEVPRHGLWSAIVDGSVPTQTVSKSPRDKLAITSKRAAIPELACDVDDDDLALALSTELPAWESAEDLLAVQEDTTEQQKPKKKKLQKPRRQRSGTRSLVRIGNALEAVQKPSSVTQNKSNPKIDTPKLSTLFKNERRESSKHSLVKSRDSIPCLDVTTANRSNCQLKQKVNQSGKSSNAIFNSEKNNKAKLTDRHKKPQAIEAEGKIIKGTANNAEHRETLLSRKALLKRCEESRKAISEFTQDNICSLISEDKNGHVSRQFKDVSSFDPNEDSSIQNKNMKGSCGHTDSTGSMQTQFCQESRESIEVDEFKNGKKCSNGSFASFYIAYSKNKGVSSEDSICSRKNGEEYDWKMQRKNSEGSTCPREILDLKKTDSTDSFAACKVNSKENVNNISGKKSKKSVRFSFPETATGENEYSNLNSCTKTEKKFKAKRLQLRTKAASDPVDSGRVKSLYYTHKNGCDLNGAPLGIIDSHIKVISPIADESVNNLKKLSIIDSQVTVIPPVADEGINNFNKLSKPKMRKSNVQKTNFSVVSCKSERPVVQQNETTLSKRVSTRMYLMRPKKNLDTQNNKYVGMPTSRIKETGVLSGETAKEMPTDVRLSKVSEENSCTPGNLAPQHLQQENSDTIENCEYSRNGIMQMEGNCKSARKELIEHINADSDGTIEEQDCRGDLGKKCRARSGSANTIRDKAGFATQMLQLGTRQYCMKAVQNKKESSLKFESVKAAGNGMSLMFCPSAAAQFAEKMKLAEDVLAGLQPLDADNLPTQQTLIKRMTIDNDSCKYYLEVKENENGRYVRVTHQYPSLTGATPKLIFPAESVGVVRDKIEGFLHSRTPARSPRTARLRSRPLGFSRP